MKMEKGGVVGRGTFGGIFFCYFGNTCKSPFRKVYRHSIPFYCITYGLLFATPAPLVVTSCDICYICSEYPLSEAVMRIPYSFPKGLLN